MLSRRTLAVTACVVSAASLAFASAAAAPAPSPSTPDGIDARAIYMEHCAKCHGETGDGKGNESLERPARSFLDGGYSYGNTQKAVTRSVVHGIPGTPMPAFGETLDAEKIAAVVDYVIALGPEGTIVEPGASVMTVGDRPVVVHGMMPAYEQGKFREPRSVVVGFPNGTTFQYRQGDARLLAVRQGDFLDRRDWGGRGGAALKPLGALVWKTNGALESGTEYVDVASGAPLARRITGTAVRGDSVWLDFELRAPNGERVGGGQEIVQFLMVEGVPVPVRAVLGVSPTTAIALRKLEPIEGAEQAAYIQDFDVEIASYAAIADPIVMVTTPVAKGVWAVEPSDAPGLRIYVHAEQWSEALAAAVNESLNEQD